MTPPGEFIVPAPKKNLEAEDRRASSASKRRRLWTKMLPNYKILIDPFFSSLGSWSIKRAGLTLLERVILRSSFDYESKKDPRKYPLAIEKFRFIGPMQKVLMCFISIMLICEAQISHYTMWYYVFIISVYVMDALFIIR